MPGCGTPRANTTFLIDYNALPSDDSLARERFLEHTRNTEVDNPEWYVSAANFYYSKSDSYVNISTKPPEAGDVALTESPSGQVAGSISAAPPNADDVSTAVEILRRGLQRFPDRLDMRFGLAHILQSARDADKEIVVLEETAQYAATHATQLRWMHDGDLPSPAEQFIPETLQSYAKYYFDQEDPAGSAYALAISALSMRFYPKHPYAYNSLAVYWYTKNDLTKALAYLRQAHDRDPNDPLVLYNLANISRELGDAPEARRYFELVLACKTTETDLRMAAQQKLNELGACPR